MPSNGLGRGYCIDGLRIEDKKECLETIESSLVVWINDFLLSVEVKEEI